MNSRIAFGASPSIIGWHLFIIGLKPLICLKNWKRQSRIDEKLPKIMMIKVLKLLNFGESWKKGKEKKVDWKITAVIR